MLERVVWFVLGVVVAPVLKPLLRPAAREVIKGGLVLGRQLERITAEVREDLEDMAAEAASELDQKGGPAPPNGANGSGA